MPMSDYTSNRDQAYFQIIVHSDANINCTEVIFNTNTTKSVKGKNVLSIIL